LNQLEINTDHGASSYDDTQISVTRTYANGGGMRKTFQSIDNTGLVKIYNCDRMGYTAPVDVSSFDFIVENGVDVTVNWDEVLAESTKIESGCEIAFEIDSVENGIAADALNPVTDYASHFTFDLDPGVRSMTVHHTIDVDGIWVFNMQVGMKAGTARTDFTITVVVYVPCDETLVLYPTALADPWAQYVVKETEIEKTFEPFTSQYTFSCPVTHYEWRLKGADGSYGAFDSNLVSLDNRLASETLSFKVFTNDNDFAHNGGDNLYEGAIFAEAEDSRVPEVSTPLNMYVFYNCRDVAIEVDPSLGDTNSFTDYEHAYIRVVVAEGSEDFTFPIVRYVDQANDAICGIYEVDYLLVETDWTDGGDHNPALSTIVFATNNNHISLDPAQND
jgi:hypothetical protein